EEWRKNVLTGSSLAGAVENRLLAFLPRSDLAHVLQVVGKETVDHPEDTRLRVRLEDRVTCLRREPAEVLQRSSRKQLVGASSRGFHGVEHGFWIGGPHRRICTPQDHVARHQKTPSSIDRTEQPYRAPIAPRT